MENIVSYAEKQLETFDQRPFCPVDSLILSWAAYLHFPAASAEVYRWSGIRIAELFRAEAFAELFAEMWDMEQSRRLFAALAASPRFRDVRVCGYIQKTDLEKEQQFAAVLFRLNRNLSYVAFRGTDLSLVGWKENFNMAFQCPVPSQEEARRYVAEAARYCEGGLLLGGHSKGGNLAVYAAAKSEAPVWERIVRVYSHDGPGFLEEVVRTEGLVRAAAKVDKTLPQASIVGLLLEQNGAYRVVKSKGISVWQHDPFTWFVDGTDFRYLEHLAPQAEYFDRTLTDWLSQISDAERERFVEALYGVLSSNEIERVTDFRSDWQTIVPAVMRSASQMDEDTRRFLLRTVKALAIQGVKNFKKSAEDE